MYSRVLFACHHCRVVAFLGWGIQPLKGRRVRGGAIGDALIGVSRIWSLPVGAGGQGEGNGYPLRPLPFLSLLCPKLWVAVGSRGGQVRTFRWKFFVTYVYIQADFLFEFLSPHFAS